MSEISVSKGVMAMNTRVMAYVCLGWSAMGGVCRVWCAGGACKVMLYGVGWGGVGWGGVG